MKPRVLATIVGARPQFIKAAALSKAIAVDERFEEKLIHTGQHYDLNMSGIFFSEMNLPPPSYNLSVGSGNHGDQTGMMMISVETVLKEIQPDCVIVYGNINSTLAGSLVAAKLQIPVAHVEAGLRSFNRRMPEEINRICADHLSSYLFTPTPTAVDNLLREGVSRKSIHPVGDIMLDAFQLFSDVAAGCSTVLGRLGLDNRRFAIATVHRAENTADTIRLSQIFKAFDLLAQDIPVLFPMHPRVRNLLKLRPDLGDLLKNVTVLPALSYLDMLALQNKACLIATDSGGLQKEAYFARCPCVTLRTETEWTELVDSGWNRLVSPDSCAQEIYQQILAQMVAPTSDLSEAITCYGNGDCAQKILTALA
ncbi:MAG: UDP-N-acetylglucosamine 2-epimerase (non-hydrolyzing) [Myxococcota bacterium]